MYSLSKFSSRDVLVWMLRLTKLTVTPLCTSAAQIESRRRQYRRKGRSATGSIFVGVSSTLDTPSILILP